MSPVLVASALTGGLVSALLPIVNAELLLVGLVLTASSTAGPFLVVAVALGQMAGKSVIYLTGGRLAHAALDPKLTRWGLHHYGAHVRTPLIVVSAVFGLPPFYLVAVAAPALRVPFRTFLWAGLAGRLLRFAAIAAIPGLVHTVAT